MPRAVLQGIAFAVDAVLAVGAAIAVVVSLTGGGELHVGGILLRLHSVDRLLILVGLLAAIRFRALARFAFLGSTRWTVPFLAHKCRSAVASLDRFLSIGRGRMQWTVVGLLTAGVLAAKVVNAAIHPGFFSGDDVEIQEMTLSAIFHAHWPVWNLRSPVFPMVFVYPAQRLAVLSGVTGTGALVIAGRLVVAIASTAIIPLTYWIARRRVDAAVAVGTAWFIATAHLAVEFGGSELPRPIAAVLVFTAFWLLWGRGMGRATAAGALIAFAGAFRFSEFVFAIPALVQLILSRRWRDAALFVSAGAAVTAAALGGGDWLYWHTPFASLRAMVDFTVVRSASSRGVQPFLYYFLHPNAWSDVVTIAFAVIGLGRTRWPLTLWLCVPILLLSCLPHKEPRYLVPVLPFVALSASFGLSRVLSWVRLESTATTAAAVLLTALAGHFLYNYSKLHIVRSDEDVRLISAIDAIHPVRGLAADMPWRFGGHLYVRGAMTVVGLDPGTQFADVDRLDPAIDTVAISNERCPADRCAAPMLARRFAEVQIPDGIEARYHVFRR